MFFLHFSVIFVLLVVRFLISTFWNNYAKEIQEDKEWIETVIEHGYLLRRFLPGGIGNVGKFNKIKIIKFNKILLF